ncbi:MAG: hypothetical protein EAZ89_16625 [Bacteroidetes bacterium]|nr:MAG: hypothetical protein EAZ89_16625 [Bacteroidota bacterium]
MRKLYLLLAHMAPLWVAAQNILFIPFGLSEAEVKQFLGSKEYIVEVTEDTQMHSVRAVLDENKHVEYAFDKGELYATTITRNYTDHKKAKEVQRSCLDYMEKMSRGASIRETTEGKITCYSVAVEGRVLKLFVQTHDESITLTLSSVSRAHGPIMEDEKLFFEEELLQRQFIEN